MNKGNFSTLSSTSTQENYFDEFLSALNGPAMVIDNQGEVLACNNALLEFYNCSKPCLLNHDLFSFCKNNNISPPFATIAESLTNTKTITTNTILKSGKNVTLAVQWSVSQIKQGRHRNAILAIGFEITDFINASTHEKHIKNAIIDQIPNHYIFWKDKNSVYLGCNTALALEVGLKSNSEIIGKTDYDLPTTLEQSEAYRNDDRAVMKSGKAKLNIEEQQTLSHGIVRTLSTSKCPLFDEHGNVCGVLAISSDITERKRIEKELVDAIERVKKAEITRAKAEAATIISNTKAEAEEEMRGTVMVLVGNIVHDLRTPITTIRTVADILDYMLPDLLEIIEEARTLGSKKIALLNKKRWDYLADRTPIHSIKNSVLMIDDFIKETLQELTNAQQDQSLTSFKENLTKCSSRRIIENTLDAYPFSDNIIIHQQISHEFYLMGNSILLMKILFNLIKNALEQISLNNKGEITISTETTPQGNLIKIKDTAGGARPEVVANFFKGYFTTKKNGTGVGLAFCKKTMENFGGNIVCHSIEGESMEFTLVFPKIE